MTTPADKRIDLLPCPFCGKEAALGTIRYSDNTVKVQGWKQDTFHKVNCIYCGSNNLGLVGFRSPTEAIEHWNRRADLASVKDAAYEKAAQTCEARIMPQPDDIDCQEANWNSEAQGCANFIRALKTAPKGK